MLPIIKTVCLSQCAEILSYLVLAVYDYPPCTDPEGRGGGGPPNNHKNIGFVSNIGLDPLIIHKATKPAFNIGLF